MRRCPEGHTGHIETNGERPSSPDLTLLCTAPVKPEDSTFDHLPLNHPDRLVCGAQWTPND